MLPVCKAACAFWDVARKCQDASDVVWKYLSGLSNVLPDTWTIQYYYWLLDTTWVSGSSSGWKRTGLARLLATTWVSGSSSGWQRTGMLSFCRLASLLAITWVSGSSSGWKRTGMLSSCRLARLLATTWVSGSSSGWKRTGLAKLLATTCVRSLSVSFFIEKEPRKQLRMKRKRKGER